MITTYPPENTAVVNMSGAGYVSCGNALAVSFSGQAPYTMECWFRLHQLAEGAIFSKQGEFVFSVTKNDQDQYVLYTKRTGAISGLDGATPLETNVWHYAAVTYDGQQVRLYLDGGLENSMITHDNGTPNLGNDFQIGADGGTNALDADFWDFHVWDVARTQAEIWEAPWVEPTAGEAGLVASYDFAVIPPVENSGRSNPPPSLQAGAFSQRAIPGLFLSGSAYADPSNEHDLNPGGNDPYTIQGWIYLSNTTGTQVIFANGDFDAGNGIAFYVKDGKLVSQRGGSSTNPVTSNITLQAGIWYNVATTYDGSSILNLYVNGASQGSGTFGALPSGEGDVLIGASSDSGDHANYFQGYIQDVMIWTTGLTSDQINTYMTQAPAYDATGLAAVFGFTYAPARDLIDAHSVTLEGGAVILPLLDPASSPGADVEAFTPTTRIRPKEEERPILNLEDLKHLPEKLPLPDVSGWQHEPFSEGHQQAMMDEFLRFIPGRMDEEDRKQLIEEFKAEVSEAFAKASESDIPLAAPHVVYTQEDGCHVLREHRRDGPVTLLRVPLDALDYSIVWWVKFLYTLVSGVMGLFQFATPPQSTCEKMLKMMLANQAFVETVNTIVGAVFTAGSILTTLKTIYDFGYFKTLVEFMIWDAGWYLVFQFFLNILALFSAPVGAAKVAYFLLKLAKLTADLIKLIQNPSMMQQPVSLQSTG